MSETQKQEITLLSTTNELEMTIRVHALQEAVKWCNDGAPSEHVIKVAKTFENYLRTGE